jgi:dTDP-4-amino-4,6-dideoxygalactose transaminase
LPPLEDYTALLEEIWASRMLSNFGPFAVRLEQLASDYVGSDAVLAVVSGDIGLTLTLRALELPAGAPCFLSDFTFNSTINAALWNRLQPVLVDIEPDTFNLSPSSLEEAMGSHSEQGVILATHVFGNPCNADELARMGSDHGSYLVFDAAHAYGSLRDGVHVGSFGDAEVFSLSGTKLTTSAEGGLVSTPHGWLRERLEYLRGYGFQFDYDSHFVGLNGKISELHCALGLLTAAKIEDAVRHRHRVVARYRDALDDCVGWQFVRPNDRSTYKDVAVRLGVRRDGVEAALTRAGVETKNYFRPLHSQRAYAQYASAPLPVSAETHRSTLCLPAFADLSDAQIDFIAGVVKAAVGSDQEDAVGRPAI